MNDIKEAFQATWPLERIVDLPIEQYTNLEKDSFTHWVESKTYEIGSIWGGSSYKFGIFKRKNLTSEPSGHLSSDGEYSWYTRYGSTAEEAYAQVLDHIITVIKAAQKDDFDTIESIDLGQAYKWKIASLYSDNIVYFFKLQDLRSVAKKHGFRQAKKANAAQLYNFFAVRRNGENLTSYSKQLYAQRDTEIRYWVYAPGEQANLWESFRNEGIAALGWDDLGDLSAYATKKEIKDNLNRLTNSSGSRKNDSTANWEFVNVMTIGDVLFVKQGRNKVVGRGEVSSDYYFDEDSAEYRSRREINWTHNVDIDVDWNFPPKTLTDVTNYKADNSQFDFYYEKLEALFSTPNRTVEDQPLNQILYGPPGTGKTRRTVELASEIVMGVPSSSYEEALANFNKHLHDKIEFITFHQNYSYEDFVQGLRPDITAQSLSFDRDDGIFTRMCIDALFEYYKVYKLNSESSQRGKDIEEVYLDFVNSLRTKEDRKFKSSTGALIILKGFTKNNNIEFGHENSIRKYLVSGQRLMKLYNAFPSINEIKNVHQDIRDAIGGCNTTVYWVALNQFIKFYDSYRSTGTKEDKDEFEGLDYQTKKELLGNLDFSILREVISNEVPKYVLIIDEINRANISRVFGELITLLEPDKRSHGEIPITCTLPSGEKLTVPSNLYIIGTMNTADKSIALLDVALRRRFEFIPMYPKYSGFDDSVVLNDQVFLQKINEIIARERGKGPDFTVGHSYFITKKGKAYDRVSTFNNKVIPLLMEYFMNDKRKVKELLGQVDSTLASEEDDFVLRLKA